MRAKLFQLAPIGVALPVLMPDGISDPGRDEEVQPFERRVGGVEQIEPLADGLIELEQLVRDKHKVPPTVRTV